MPAPRSGARQWIASGAFLASVILGWPTEAGAATKSFDVGDQAVVQVIGHAAAIVIRTWDRDAVRVDYPDGGGFVISKGIQETRSTIFIPPVSVKEENAPDGAVEATLLPEDFPIPKIAPGMHDVVRVVEPAPAPGKGDARAPGTGRITVMIPETTGLVNVRTGRSRVLLTGYHGTTIVTLGRGRLIFDNVSGDAFVQPLNGHFYANESTFDRLRIRSNRADVVFDACRASQIEVTTLTGNIMFDNGIFEPGLARFESDRGSIALGVNGGAQLGAHTLDGHVLTVLPQAPPSPLIGSADSDGLQIAGNGGPLVNVQSNHGDVLLYDGSLAERRPAALPPAWHAMYDLLLMNRDVARGRPALLTAQPLRRPAPREARPAPNRSTDVSVPPRS